MIPNETFRCRHAFWVMVIAIFAVPLSGFTLEFNPPIPANTNELTTGTRNGYVKMAADGSGTWLAFWATGISKPVAHDDPATPDGLNQDIVFSRSVDNGKTWSAPAQLKSNAATDDGDDLEPDAATDGHGNWCVVWRSLDTQGGRYPAWRHLLTSHSTDNGATWSAPILLNTDAVTNTSDTIRPALATDSHGNWVVYWGVVQLTSSWYSAVRTARSNDNGAHWSPPVTMQETYNYADAMPALVTDGQGRWIACWNFYTTDIYHWKIMMSKSDDNGLHWSAPAILSNNALASYFGDYQMPSLATDGHGRWVAAWHSADSLGGTIGNDDDILYVRSSDNGNTWTNAAPLNHNAATDQGQDMGVKLTVGPGNYWVASWSSTDTLGGTLGTNLKQLFATSTDGGQTWSTPALLNSNARIGLTADGGNGGMYHANALATDRHGRWMAAWESYPSTGSPNGHSNIFFSASKPQVLLFSLNGQSPFSSGGPISIEWAADPNVAGSAIRVELWKGSDLIEDIGYAWSSSGWGDNIANLTLPLVPEGNDYHLRVISNWNPAIIADSDQTFSIHGGVVQVIMPSGGEFWRAGDMQPVWWAINPLLVGQAVKLELWHGGVWAADLGIGWDPSGEGVSQIQVPSVAPGNNYKIRAVSLWNPNYYGESSGFLSIQNNHYIPPRNAVKGEVWDLYQ